MSDLRIRSEAVPNEIWPESFLPPQARPTRDLDDDDSDFGPFLIASGRALSQLFGQPVEVLPGRPPKAVGGDAVPQVAAVLAALLATLQLGGDVSRPPATAVPAPATARQARAIAGVLAAVALRVWPIGCRLPGFDVDIACAGIAGHAHVPAPDVAPPPAVRPVAALARRLFELPMRVRVELSSDLATITALLPLREGTVLPIDPTREMPLLLGDHRIGRATLAPMPDGRQQATIVAIGVEALGGGFS